VCHAETGLETVTDYPDGWRGRRQYVCAGPADRTTCQLVLLRRERMEERRALQERDAHYQGILSEDAERWAGVLREDAERWAAVLAEAEESTEGRRPRSKPRPPRRR
jgi:hypothetical protein